MRGKRERGLALLGALLVGFVCGVSTLRSRAEEPRASTGAHAQAGLGAGASMPRASSTELAIQVESWLSAGVEGSAAHEKIAALGDAGELALQSVFEREAAPRYVRLRALSELGSFGTEASALYLAALVHRAQKPDASLGDLHPGRSALALRRALEGLIETGRSLGPQLPVDDVAWCLQHPDAHVRRVASDVLATLDGSAAQHALQKHLPTERSRMVRGSVTRALSVRAAQPVRGQSAQ
jgi:hypothetical protein